MVEPKISGQPGWVNSIRPKLGQKLKHFLGLGFNLILVSASLYIIISK